MMKARVEAYCEGIKAIKNMCKSLEKRCDEAIGLAEVDDEIPDTEIWHTIKCMHELYGFWHW